MVRRWSNKFDRGWIVSLPDGAVGAVPFWMTDASKCAGLSQGLPQLSLDALVELARLLDAQPGPSVAPDPLGKEKRDGKVRASATDRLG